MEAPVFGIPTVNIGDRQKGRIQASSVINCEPVKEDILRAIDTALSDSFAKKAKETVSPYGDGHTSDKVIEVIKEYLLDKKIDLKKSFMIVRWIYENLRSYRRDPAQKGLRINIRLLNGKPLLAYSIEAAKESGLFDEIMVSTDCKGMPKSRTMGSECPFPANRRNIWRHCFIVGCSQRSYKKVQGIGK